MRLGLIADTHIPDRGRELPPSIPAIFRDVDLILHAGDIGDLGVLRHLEAIAPVVAVQGNDEPEAAKDALPLEATLDLDGMKLLLIHGDDADPARELALRREDRWFKKLDYWRGRGAAAGADIVVFGHTHVPVAVCGKGILLVNPGALASGSFFYRQTLRTVAILTADRDVTHIDVDQPDRKVVLPEEWERGFSHALGQFHRPMYDQAVIEAARSGWLRENLYPVAPEQLRKCVYSLSGECWFGDRDWVTASDFVRELLNDPVSRPALESALRDSEHLSAFATG